MMDISADLELLISAAKKWGGMLDGLRERGLLVQGMRTEDTNEYRRRISDAAERVREATRCSQR